MLISKYVDSVEPHVSTQLSGPTLACPPAATFGLAGAPPAASLMGVFDSWAWQHRKPLVVGGVGLLGLALLSGLASVLR